MFSQKQALDLSIKLIAFCFVVSLIKLSYKSVIMDKSRAISATTVAGNIPEELDDPDKDFSDEDDFELLIDFDPDNAMTRLFSLNNSITLTIE